MGGLCQICGYGQIVEQKKKKKMDRIYAFCHLSHYLPIFLYLHCQKCDCPEPIIRVPWLNVYSESVTQPEASVVL